MSRRITSNLLLSILVFALIVGSAMPAYADGECEHDWFVHTTVIDERGETQHITYINYMCNYCMETKQDAIKEDHQWETVSRGKCQKAGAAYHTCAVEQECSYCGKTKKETIKEEHLFNKFHVCTLCGYKKSEIISLKPGKTAYVNENTALKLVFTKNGYITVKVQTKDGKDGIWRFCTGKGVAYKEGTFVGMETVPVNKGTYMIKPASEGTVTYIFRKDPSKKNYTWIKAASLKKNKRVVSVLYTKSNKKTWKRYYKIKTGKKQRVHITVSEGYPKQSKAAKRSYLKTSLFTSKGKAVKLKAEFDKTGRITGYVSSKKLKKGTYYIVLTGKWSSSSKKASTGTFVALSWK